MLYNNRDLFTDDICNLPGTDLVTHTIDTGDAPPFDNDHAVIPAKLGKNLTNRLNDYLMLISLRNQTAPGEVQWCLWKRKTILIDCVSICERSILLRNQSSFLCLCWKTYSKLLPKTTHRHFQFLTLRVVFGRSSLMNHQTKDCFCYTFRKLPIQAHAIRDSGSSRQLPVLDEQNFTSRDLLLRSLLCRWYTCI